MEDINTVDHKIFSDVISEGRWGREDSNHTLKFFPVGFDVWAVFHSALDSFQDIGNLLNSINNLFGIFGFKVFESSLGILEDLFSISDAAVDISETFGIEGTLKDTTNDVLEFLGINGRSLLW